MIEHSLISQSNDIEPKTFDLKHFPKPEIKKKDIKVFHCIRFRELLGFCSIFWNFEIYIFSRFFLGKKIFKKLIFEYFLLGGKEIHHFPQ